MINLKNYLYNLGKLKTGKRNKFIFAPFILIATFGLAFGFIESLSVPAFAFAKGKPKVDLSSPNAIESKTARVWIFKEDGSISCEGKGEPEKALRTELETQGIRVHSGKKESDGKMHMQMCGAPTGKGYAFEIDAKDLFKAEGLGFKRLVGANSLEKN